MKIALFFALASMAVLVSCSFFSNKAYAASDLTAATKRYPIIYVMNGGDFTTGYRKTVASGKIVSAAKLAVPKRRGYKFMGWYSNAKLTKKAVKVKGVASKKMRTVYAKWKAKAYTITYNLAGGAFTGDYQQTYKVTSSFALPTPRKAGYVFLGWHKTRNVRSKVVSAIERGTTGNKTYYAKWTKRYLVGHRGYRKTEVDNSIEGFQKARSLGFEWCEADVRFTKDGVAVVNHGDQVKVKVATSHIEVTKKGKKKTVKGTVLLTMGIDDLTLSEIQAVPLKRKKSGLTIGYNTNNVLTFDELMKECRSSGLNINIDLKDDAIYQIDNLMSIVRANGMQNRVRWLSVNFSKLAYIQSKQSNAKLMYGHSIDSQAISSLARLRSRGANVMIQPRYNAISASKAAACRNAGVLVATWGLADETSVRHLNSYVCCITVDGLSAGVMPTYIE